MGNSTGFHRFSVVELKTTDVGGVPAYTRVVRRLIENGYMDSFLESAPEVHDHLLGGLDSIGSFFDDLDALVRSSGRIDALAFLLHQPSRADVAAHDAQLPGAGVAFARIGAVVLSRDDFLELRGALQRATSVLREDLEHVLEAPPPEPNEIDVWLTQGGGEIEVGLDAFPLERGGPPRPPRWFDFEHPVRIRVLLIGGVFAAPIVSIIVGAIWTALTHVLR